MPVDTWSKRTFVLESGAHRRVESNRFEKGVDFAACRFSMKERNVKEEQLMQNVRIVDTGIIEIVDKQNAGWVYIKAG